MKIKRLSHPFYSPDLGPCDFQFFGQAKTLLRNRRFADADMVVDGLINLWDNVTFEEFESMFQNWIEKLEWAIEDNRECFIGRPMKALLLFSKS
jgi:hypothetical protein